MCPAIRDMWLAIRDMWSGAGGTYLVLYNLLSCQLGHLYHATSENRRCDGDEFDHNIQKHVCCCIQMITINP